MYNGYSNYPTWNLALWIANDQRLYEHFHGLRVDLEIDDMSDTLKEFFINEMPVIDGTYSDLLQYALEQVDWREVAATINAE